MKFLITGGAGFIGSNIVEALLIGKARGLSPSEASGTVPEQVFVRVLDNFSSGKKENLAFTKGLSPSEASEKNGDRLLDKKKGLSPTQLIYEAPQGTVPSFELLEGDIRDKAACNKACDGIDAVLHQAALRSVPKSMKDPESYNEVNIGGTLNMLQAAAKNKVKRFVFASSSSVYGDTSKFPEQETDYPLLISPYALSKLAGEYYCRIFSEHFGLETVCLRYFNVFGPRQALDDEYAVVIPKFIHCILHDEQPPIFGTGKQSRDFTYIDNVVEANILAATKGLKKMGTDSEVKGLSPIAGWGQTPKEPCPHLEQQQGTVPDSKKVTHEVFNVANGKDNTVLQLVDSLNKIIGKTIKPKFLPVRAGDVFRTCADITKIKAKLGYEPKVDFEEGLKRTVEYFRRACP